MMTRCRCIAMISWLVPASVADLLASSSAVDATWIASSARCISGGVVLWVGMMRSREFVDVVTEDRGDPTVDFFVGSQGSPHRLGGSPSGTSGWSQLWCLQGSAK